MCIRDSGSQVYSQTGLVAKGGTGTQTIDFPADDNYRMEVQVTGITKDGQGVDQTRNGVARGTVVVPEFSIGSFMVPAVIAVIIGATIIVSRRFMTISSDLGLK